MYFRQVFVQMVAVLPGSFELQASSGQAYPEGVMAFEI